MKRRSENENENIKNEYNDDGSIWFNNGGIIGI